jgi:Cu/Ag efflux protein CusF
MQSAMPAFKTVLSEDQRWDVLAYVHTYFHLGLAKWHPEKNGPRPSEAAGRPTVVGEGKIIAVVPNTQQIVVEHGEIKGFMGAMTMGYKVNPPSLLNNGFKAGDTIRFTIDTQQKAIVKIEKLRQG